MKRLIAPALALAATAGVIAAPAFGATKTIDVRDNFFSPKTTSVKKGTTVRWVWEGRAPHNVNVRSGPAKFRSNTQTTGTFRKKMKKKGVYRLNCTIHPGMDMTLRVR